MGETLTLKTAWARAFWRDSTAHADPLRHYMIMGGQQNPGLSGTHRVLLLCSCKAVSSVLAYSKHSASVRCLEGSMMMGSTGVSSHPEASGSSGSFVPLGDADRCTKEAMLPPNRNGTGTIIGNRL